MRCPLSRRIVAAALSGALTLWMPSMPFAATTTTTFQVTATINNSCTVSAPTVAFGAISAGAAATNTANTITLTCNHKATVSAVALNNGSNASGTQKRMTDGTDFLNYLIDVPTGATFNTCPAAGAGPEWNATNTIVATSLFAASGGPKPINICASIPAAQYPEAGAYTDTVQITVTFA
ncbi:MAG TPA: spore coat protein U domain-containing protein [Burkholderiales bacterium]|nr:spore coat protein U domain-containing protein [Burkholderiales bacterium]